MRQKSGPDKAPAEQVVKDIRRAARRHFSGEDKIRIVLNAADGRLDLPHVCQRLNLLEFQHGVPALQITRHLICHSIPWPGGWVLRAGPASCHHLTGRHGHQLRPIGRLKLSPSDKVLPGGSQ